MLAQKRLSSQQLKTSRQRFEQEDDVEIKRAWLQLLCQLSKEEFEKLVRELAFTADSKLHRLGRFFDGLLSEGSRGREAIRSVFDDFHEEKLVDRMYQIEILAKAKDAETRLQLLKEIRRVKRYVRRPMLKDRINYVERELTGRSGNSIQNPSTVLKQKRFRF